MRASQIVRRWVGITFVLLLSPISGARPQSPPGDGLAIHELVANASFDDEASGWTLEEARAVPGLGPAGDAAVVLDPASCAA